MSKKTGKSTATTTGKGKSQIKPLPPLVSRTTEYKLSDPKFISLQWTKLPHVIQSGSIIKTKIWNCFKKRASVKYMHYPKGQVAGKFELDGTGKIFYIDGTLAIELKEYYTGYQRIILYNEKVSESQDQLNRQQGWLDNLGNCILYNTDGKLIANYDQTGGIIYDKETFVRWSWVQLNSKLIRRSSTEIAKKMNQLHLPSIKSAGKIDTVNNHQKSKEFKKSNGGSFKYHMSNPKKTISAELLQLYIDKSPEFHRLSPLPRGKYIICKVSNSISLWISSQDKIDLSFSSNSFIMRLEVGISLDEEVLRKTSLVPPFHKHEFVMPPSPSKVSR